MLVSIWSRLILFAWHSYQEENLCGSFHSGLSAMKETNKITLLELLSCEKWSELRCAHEFLWYLSRIKPNCNDVLRDHMAALVPRWKSIEDVVATEKAKVKAHNEISVNAVLTGKESCSNSAVPIQVLIPIGWLHSYLLMTFLNLLIPMTCYTLGFGF